MAYIKKHIQLSERQIARLRDAAENETAISFAKYGSKGIVPVYLTDGQIRAMEHNKPIKFSKKQMRYMKTQGGFLGALLKLLGPALKVIAPVARTLAPAVATGALSGAASYGANKLLRKATGDDKRGRGFQLKPYGKGFKLGPYTGGNVSIELTPQDINGLLHKKEGGFLGMLASLAASLLPTLLGNGLSRDEVNKAKEIIGSVAHEKSKKKAQERLDMIAKKYGSGLLGKLFGLPGGKVPVLGDIPLLNVLF